MPLFAFSTFQVPSVYPKPSRLHICWFCFEYVWNLKRGVKYFWQNKAPWWFGHSFLRSMLVLSAAMMREKKILLKKRWQKWDNLQVERMPILIHHKWYWYPTPQLWILKVHCNSQVANLGWPYFLISAAHIIPAVGFFLIGDKTSTFTQIPVFLFSTAGALVVVTV